MQLWCHRGHSHVVVFPLQSSEMICGYLKNTSRIRTEGWFVSRYSKAAVLNGLNWTCSFFLSLNISNLQSRVFTSRGAAFLHCHLCHCRSHLQSWLHLVCNAEGGHEDVCLTSRRSKNKCSKFLLREDFQIWALTVNMCPYWWPWEEDGWSWPSVPLHWGWPWTICEAEIAFLNICS